MSSEQQNPEPEGPEFEVWNYLDEGWEMAYNDLSEKLHPAGMQLLQALARSVFDLKESLLVESAFRITQELENRFPNVPSEVWGRLVKAIAAEYPQVDPWMKHAIELEVASRGIHRAHLALERFSKIAPETLARPVPEKARLYIRELVHTYLFGFDAAAIALARSTFEQLARAVLVRRGVYTEPQLRREKPTAGTLLKKLKQAGLLGSTVSAAERLVKCGDTLLHSGMQEERILPALALDSVRGLQQVAIELAEFL